LPTNWDVDVLEKEVIAPAGRVECMYNVREPRVRRRRYTHEPSAEPYWMDCVCNYRGMVSWSKACSALTSTTNPMGFQPRGSCHLDARDDFATI